MGVHRNGVHVDSFTQEVCALQLEYIIQSHAGWVLWRVVFSLCSSVIVKPISAKGAGLGLPIRVPISVVLAL